MAYDGLVTWAMVRELQEYFQYEEETPGRFCHGDFHPGNVVWGEERR